MNHTSYLAGAVAITTLAATACSAQDRAATAAVEARTTQAPTTASTATSSEGPLGRPRDAREDDLPELQLPVTGGADVHGLVDVDGHALAVHCSGSGDPTVVILHGWIDEPGITSDSYYDGLRTELDSDFRVCSYDRANVGDSETVPGTQTPQAVVGDLDGLMRKMGFTPPYVLVGQSAGGMVASAYAVAHPAKVAGMVMVDADFDEEVTLEDVAAPGTGACDPENRRLDSQESLQKIDVCAMYRWAYSRRELRPEVPLVYLAAKQAPWSDLAEFGVAYTRRIVPLQKSYAAGWSPGKFEWVDSGHDIHSERPDVVGAAVRWVLKEAH